MADTAAYVEVAGLRTWHEVTGQGESVVLLHGAFGGATSFFAQTPFLVEADPFPVVHAKTLPTTPPARLPVEHLGCRSTSSQER